MEANVEGESDDEVMKKEDLLSLMAEYEVIPRDVRTLL